VAGTGTSDNFVSLQGSDVYLRHGVRFRSAILIPNPNPIPNPSRSEPNSVSFNSLLSFRSPIRTYNYPYLRPGVYWKIYGSTTLTAADKMQCFRADLFDWPVTCSVHCSATRVAVQPGAFCNTKERKQSELYCAAAVWGTPHQCIAATATVQRR